MPTQWTRHILNHKTSFKRSNRNTLHIISIGLFCVPFQTSSCTSEALARRFHSPHTHSPVRGSSLCSTTGQGVCGVICTPPPRPHLTYTAKINGSSFTAPARFIRSAKRRESVWSSIGYGTYSVVELSPSSIRTLCLF